MNGRRLAALAGSLAMSTALVGCGSSSSFTPLTLAGFRTSVSDSVANVKTGHVDISSDLMTIHEDVSYGPPIAIGMVGQINVQGQELTYRERILDSIMYMQVPGKTPPGKFLKIDLSQLPQTAGLFKVLHQLQSAGPKSFAAQFRRGVKSLTYDGPATIGGQTVRHYTAVIDALAAVNLVGGDQAAQAFARRLKVITEQVYLNADHRPVRIEMTMPAPVGKMRIDFSKYGEPVSVTAPPSSATIDVPASELASAG